MTRTGRVFFRSIIRSYLGLVEGIISRFRFGNVCAALAGLVLGSVLVVTNATAGGMLTYNGTNFTARWQNDGGFNPVQSTITLMLTNGADAFTGANGQDFVAGGLVTVAHLPSGLVATAVRTSATNMTLALSGFTSPHTTANNINNLQFQFSNSAFLQGNASVITNASGTNVSVCFLSQVQSNWYVNGSTGLETNNGTNSATPFLSITNAIAHAQTSANDVINIAAGPPYTISPVISITKNLTFAGTNAAVTILQASATPGTAANGIFAYTANNTNAMFQGLTMQNGRAVEGGAIISSGCASDLIASNCVFMNNMATNVNGSGGAGGAIYFSQNGSVNYLTLVSCIFSNNTATNVPSACGGAVYINYGLFTVSNCVFTGNIATNLGGAIFDAQTGASIANTLFMNNKALTNAGGAFYQSLTVSGAVGIYGCTFVSNSASLLAGGMSAGGITTMNNTTFYGNTCSGNGSVGSEQGGGGFFQGNNNPCYIYNSTFIGNSAPTGGAMRIYGSGAISSSIIASNTATGGSGPDIAAHNQTSATLVLTNSLIGITNGAGGTVSLTAGAPNAYGNYCGTSTTPQNPGLLPLANNGGSVLGWPLPTCALQANSVAIHHGINPLGLPYDARGPGYPRSNALGQTDMGALDFSASLPSFVYSDNIFQGTTAGVIVTTNTISLDSTTGLDSFSGTAGTEFVSKGWLTVANVPNNLTVTATEVNSTNLSVTMTGTASSLATVNNMTFTITSNALVTTTAVSNNFAAVLSKVGTNFVTIATNYVVFDSVNNTPALLYGGTAFYESAPLNNGSITNTITISLTNTEFAGNMGDDFVALGRVQVSNLPAGLTATAILGNPYVFPQTLTVSLNGNATAHNSPNNVANLTLAFQNSAFQFVPASSVNNATTSNLQILFVNPVLSYINKAFAESWRHDGTISAPSNSVVATLVGDSFSGVVGANLYGSGQVTAQNVPSGLTPVVTMQSSTSVVISLTGAASPHTSAQNVNNLGFTYQNNAFVGILANGQSASLVTNYNESDLSVTFLSQTQSNWYVDVNNGHDNTGNGTSGNPWASITNALKHAQSSANDIIHIAAGTYIQPQISVANVVTFMGTNASVTIIEPAASPNVVTNQSVFAYGTGSLAGMFANLTIQNGRATQGGAFYDQAGADLVISNCIIANNSATNNPGRGGAIWNNASLTWPTISLISTLFSNNTCGGVGGGGAVYAYNPTLFVSNCTFTGNSATDIGGAISLAGSGNPATIVNTLFYNNTASTNAGGAVNLVQYRSVMMSGCTLYTNTSGADGGALYLGGQANATVVNTTFCNNTSTNGRGGGFYWFSNTGINTGVLYNCTFYRNTATNGGGAYFGNSGGILYSSIVASNTATTGLDPDIYQNSGNTWVTNSLIGITNGMGSSVTMNGSSATTTNSSGNYGGSVATPANPGLLNLANNGGILPTCALQANSLAIGAGCNPLGLACDERSSGYLRTNKVTGLTDMGAFELWQPPLGATGSTLFFW